MSDFILATRGSELARVQSRMVREGLVRAWPHLTVHEDVVRTTGDRHPEENLTALGGSGVFTKELEAALGEASGGGGLAAAASTRRHPAPRGNR